MTIAGGGLAGSEAAWQIATRGIPVTLYEMRPQRLTPAHKTDRLAELVCSNSLKSNAPGAASWLVKEELRRLGSLLLRLADENAVPGGSALAVDRERFPDAVTRAIECHPLIELRRAELLKIPFQGFTLIATGPLTSDTLARELQSLTGAGSLAFYDSISPIVDAETLNMERIFRASRYGKGGEDYLNCPMNGEEYRVFYEALRAAEAVETHAFEDARYFEACLPIEELARRGVDTLRFGPMKPVGLVDPRTGRQPYAVAQLRTENLRFSSFNLVGFQNHLRFPEQKRILRMIPGLERAEFLRFGQIHRNTYLNAPRLLAPDLSLRSAPGIYVAGQLSGVEGYVECIASGFLAGLAIARRAQGATFAPPPRDTALGSLIHFITHADPANYQPTNISFDLIPPVDSLPRAISRDRRARRDRQCERALQEAEQWITTVGGSQPGVGSLLTAIAACPAPLV
ncbi:MAG: methylenetetrahydrofolate--tRNA-(uracil(54)-C(5))-methyltransferase (FADH(2)-oxidizing) TrmFO [Terriglobia bacterium]